MLGTLYRQVMGGVHLPSHTKYEGWEGEDLTLLFQEHWLTSVRGLSVDL